MITDIHYKKILILDFGSQYTQLIARRIREIGVFCEVFSYRISADFIKQYQPAGIILSGGPASVAEANSPRAPQIVFELGCPVLGICYGMQTMAEQLGGKVQSSAIKEFGFAKVKIDSSSTLFADICDETTPEGDFLAVWMSHGDQVVNLPLGFQMIANTGDCPIAAMMHQEKQFFGLQFHPEVTDTKQGLRLLQRFTIDICHCEPVWTTHNIIDASIEKIKQQVGQEKVLLALSGGVDSSVVAAMLHKAIGDQLVCVFVDTGLLRLNEAQQVMATFSEHMKIHVIKVDAKKQFMQALAGVDDPEEKRKIIGKLFIEVFASEARRMFDVQWLAQGTIYPDVIESAASGDASHVIKTHHNVGGLPDDMPFKLIEPLRELFKDEVRKVGLELGLPAEMLYRHPFPGPGLGVRILGEIKEEYISLLQKADDIFISELRQHGLYEKVSQAFAVFLPIKSVAVMGDGRQYSYVIALRAVETIDFMTARWAHLPYDFIGHVSRRICNEVPHISRVVYDISDKPPATIEWE